MRSSMWSLLISMALSMSGMRGPERACAQCDDRVARARRDHDGMIVLANAPRTLAPVVTFLEESPRIDGRLDRRLESLPIREFTRYWKSNASNPSTTCLYRLAYGTDFFYVYVEAEADELTYRDRAFQNGDGFSLLISAVEADDEPTEDFYVLSCSAVNKENLEWTRRVFWYYNVDTIFMRTSENTKLEFAARDGRISFELYLPWKDVRPYHPWISDAIGFNLRFVKAVGDRGRNRYKVNPGTIGAENMPRWYTRLAFEEPRVEGRPQTHVAPLRGNLQEKEACGVLAVTAAGEPLTEEITLEITGEEHGQKRRIDEHYSCKRGLTRHHLDAIPADFTSDDYTLEWQARASGDEGAWEITVLPGFDAASAGERLRNVQNGIAPGSYTTLAYGIERTAALLADLPAYEAASYERQVVLRLNERLAEALRGEDPYATQTGYLRRAFRSQLDETLQPYVVRIPEDYDPDHSYPLVIYLHGSASDETDLIGHAYIFTDDVIAAAPFGRGHSNGFATPEAQTDIAEAIADAVANYAIDRQRIIITGFSMGGYGAYRTFFETPEMFRAVAVFSGGPHFTMEGAIDFREAENVRPFRDVPVFVYHGEGDRNVSYAGAVGTVARLRAVGAEVTFHSDPEKGHEAPTNAVVAKYHAWLAAVLSGDR